MHDWLEKDYEPINDAWSKIQVIGSPDAVDEATQLLDACADLLGFATAPGDVEQQVLKAASDRVIETREAFIQVARKELGKEATLIEAEKSRGQDVAVGASRELTQEAE